MRRIIATVVGLMLSASLAQAASSVIISEIMYNSTESTDVEWIEFYNGSGATVDLTGWYVLDDNASHTKVYLTGTMAAGEVKVLPGTVSLFTAKYPSVTSYFDISYQAAPWDLGNGGDTVNLYDATGTLACSVTYDDASPWPTEPDGNGPSLALTDPDCSNFSDATCWAAGVSDGSPGTVEFVVPTLGSTWGSLKATYR